MPCIPSRRLYKPSAFFLLFFFFTGVHVRHSSGVLASGGSAADMRHQGEGGGGGQEYEIPENIKALHHLALQYVNQVRLGGCI